MNNSSRTALIMAARNRYLETLELLLNVPGIEKSSVDKKTLNASTTVFLHHKQCVECLLNDKDVNPQLPGDSGFKHLHIALSNDFSDLIILLAERDDVGLNCVNSIQWTPLHVVAKYGSTSFVEESLKHENIDIKLQNLMKRTPIFNSIESEKSKLSKFYFLVKTLI